MMRPAVAWRLGTENWQYWERKRERASEALPGGPVTRPANSHAHSDQDSDVPLSITSIPLDIIFNRRVYYKMLSTKWFGKVEVDIGWCYCRDKEHLMERIKEICPKLPILKLHPLNGTLLTLPLAKLSLRRGRETLTQISERGEGGSAGHWVMGAQSSVQP